MTMFESVSGNWRLQAVLLVFSSLILSAFAESYTTYDFLETLFAVNAIGGLVLVAHQLNVGGGKVASSDQNEVDSVQRNSGEEDFEQVHSGESETRAGPSTGLTTEEQVLQNKMIRQDYRAFYENPLAHFVPRQPMVNEPAEDWDADAETIQKVWKVSKDDGFYKKPKKSWELTPKAVDRAEALGEEILLDEDIQEEILGLLLRSYQANPMRPVVSRDKLIEALDCSEKKVDHNIWLLREKGYIDTQAFLGDSRGYGEVEITPLGKRVAE